MTHINPHTRTSILALPRTLHTLLGIQLPLPFCASYPIVLSRSHDALLLCFWPQYMQTGVYIGRRYGCQASVLASAQNRNFLHALSYRFYCGLPLHAAPFDVTRPQAATEKVIRMLEAPLDRSEA